MNERGFIYFLDCSWWRSLNAEMDFFLSELNRWDGDWQLPFDSWIEILPSGGDELAMEEVGM